MEISFCNNCLVCYQSFKSEVPMSSNSHLQNYYNINNNHIKNTKIIAVNKKLTISEDFNNS